MQIFSMEIYGEISMEIDVLILHGIPWRIFHGNPWNSMEFDGGFSHGELGSQLAEFTTVYNYKYISNQLN